MEQFLQVETLVIELLLVVSLVAIAVRRLRIPYTVALVVVGLLFAFQSPVKIELTSPLILALFLPPLLFEAGFHKGNGSVGYIALPTAFKSSTCPS